LRDVGGIIVVDFIDMVLESNRDLVLRRLTECLGRDRTRHQVAEVTSLGLVQMTRKRVGTGLLEAFSTTCEHCRGRGVVVSTNPVHANLAPANGGNGNAQEPAAAAASNNGHHAGNGNGHGAGQQSPQQQSGGGSTRRHRHRGHHHQDQEPAPQEQPTPGPKAPEPVAAAEPQEPVVRVVNEPVAHANGHPTSVAAANPPRPTRRRAASRPAGPPGGQVTPV
jgi:ribonuclease E